MKNIKILLKTAIISALLLSGGAYADDKAGTVPGTFMKLGLGAPSAQGMGHAYTALISGTEALAWNPAGITSATQSTIGYSYLSWVHDYSGHYFAFLQPVGTAVIGANIGYLRDNNFDARDDSGTPVANDVKVQDSFITLGIAHSFFTEALSIGGAIKRVAEDNDGSVYTSIVFDVGAQFKLGKLIALGAAVQNIGASDDVVRLTRLGASITPLSFATISGEYEIPSDNRGRFGIGLELFLDEDVIQVGRISVRLGYFDNDYMGKNRDSDFLDDFGLSDSSKISFGVGMYTGQLMGYGLGFNYAMSTLGSLGVTHQISLTFEF